MFKYLRAEMVRVDVNVEKLAEMIGMSIGALYARLSGKVPFTIDEAVAIKKALGVDIPIEELFATKEE